MFSIVVSHVHAEGVTFPPGSHIGLVPPGAMKPSANFRGFEDKDAAASILIIEMPPKAYTQIEKELGSASLKKQSVAEERRETIQLKNGKGLLIVGDQLIKDAKLRKWIFLISNSQATALISAQVSDTAKKIYSDSVMRTALASVMVRPTIPIDEQLNLLPIKFTDLAGLRPFRVGPNAVFMTDGPADTLKATEQPLLLVSIGPGNPEAQSSRQNFVHNLFTSLSEFKEMRLISSDVLRIDHQPVYEIQAEAKDAETNAPLKLVQWVRFGGNAFIRIVGVAKSDAWKENFPRFRTVRDSIEQR